MKVRVTKPTKKKSHHNYRNNIVENKLLIKNCKIHGRPKPTTPIQFELAPKHKGICKQRSKTMNNNENNNTKPAPTPKPPERPKPTIKQINESGNSNKQPKK